MGDFNFQNDARNIMKRSRQEDESSQDAHCQFKRLRIDNENNNNNNIMLSGIVSPNDTEDSYSFEGNRLNSELPGHTSRTYHYDSESMLGNHNTIENNNNFHDERPHTIRYLSGGSSASLYNSNENLAQNVIQSNFVSHNQDNNHNHNQNNHQNMNQILGNLNKERMLRSKMRENCKNHQSIQNGKEIISESWRNQHIQEHPKSINQQNRKKRTVKLQSHSSLF